MTDGSQRLKGFLLTAFGVLVLTPDAVLIRLIEADAWTLLFWRGLFQCVALLIGYGLVYRERAVHVLRSAGRMGLFVGCSYALGNILFIHAITNTSTSNTLLIVSSAPLIAAVFSRLFLKEKTALHTWLAASVALVGVAVIFSGGDNSGSMKGNILALASAMCMAGSFVLIRHARLVSMVPAVAFSGFVMDVVVSPLIPDVGVSSRDLLYLFLLGAVIMPIAFGLITLGPRYISAPEVSLLMLIETILGPTWVWLALGEQPGARTWFGGAVVLSALIGHSVVAIVGERFQCSGFRKEKE